MPQRLHISADMRRSTSISTFLVVAMAVQDLNPLHFPMCMKAYMKNSVNESKVDTREHEICHTVIVATSTNGRDTLVAYPHIYNSQRSISLRPSLFLNQTARCLRITEKPKQNTNTEKFNFDVTRMISSPSQFLSSRRKAFHVGPLSPRHGASSGCGWRRRPPGMDEAANILKNQSRTADKGWSSSSGVGRGASNSSP
jgi:hypothetical protein